MIRGTTAPFKFTLPYTKDKILLAEAKFWQSGNDKGLERDYPLPIVKHYSQTNWNNGIQYPWNWIDDSTLVVTLGQRETLTFSDKYKARIQLRVRTTDNLVFASEQQIINVYPANWDAPLGDDIIIPTSENEWVILDGNTIGTGG